MFGPVLPALAERHQVIAVDLQGHGRTADIDRPLDVRGHATRGSRETTRGCSLRLWFQLLALSSGPRTAQIGSRAGRISGVDRVPDQSVLTLGERPFLPARLGAGGGVVVAR